MGLFRIRELKSWPSWQRQLLQVTSWAGVQRRFDHRTHYGGLPKFLNLRATGAYIGKPADPVGFMSYKSWSSAFFLSSQCDHGSSAQEDWWAFLCRWLKANMKSFFLIFEQKSRMQKTLGNEEIQLERKKDPKYSYLPVFFSFDSSQSSEPLEPMLIDCVHMWTHEHTHTGLLSGQCTWSITHWFIPPKHLHQAHPHLHS